MKTRYIIKWNGGRESYTFVVDNSQLRHNYGDMVNIGQLVETPNNPAPPSGIYRVIGQPSIHLISNYELQVVTLYEHID